MDTISKQKELDDFKNQNWNKNFFSNILKEGFNIKENNTDKMKASNESKGLSSSFTFGNQTSGNYHPQNSN